MSARPCVRRYLHVRRLSWRKPAVTASSRQILICRNASMTGRGLISTRTSWWIGHLPRLYRHHQLCHPHRQLLLQLRHHRHHRQCPLIRPCYHLGVQTSTALTRVRTAAHLSLCRRRRAAPTATSLHATTTAVLGTMELSPAAHPSYHLANQRHLRLPRRRTQCSYQEPRANVC